MSRRAFVVQFVAALALGAGLVCAGCDEDPEPKAPAGAGETEMPWPLPLPSSSMEIPAELRAKAEPQSHLDTASNRLAAALHAAGYSDLRYYDIPEGFALITPLELIDDQGLGIHHPNPALRFSSAYPPERFFTMRFWSQLLSGKVGRFRLFVFVVIEHPFGYAIDVTDRQILWKHPSPDLPLSRSDLPYTDRDHWYALVYEVVHPRGTDTVKLAPNPGDPVAHLEKSGVLDALRRLAGAAGAGLADAGVAGPGAQP